MESNIYKRIPRRTEIAQHHKESGGLIAAVLPIHYPRALLRAFNVQPMEVWGPPRVNESYGVAHLQPYVCSIVRNALSFLLSGGMDLTDLILVPHACDSLQGLGSILLDFIHPAQPVIPLYLPRNAGQSAVEYLAQELRALFQRLEEVTQRTPLESELFEHILGEERADQIVSQLHNQRSCLPLGDYEFYSIIRSREFLPAEEFSQIARSVLQSKMSQRRRGTPIILSGIVPEPMQILKAISDLGGMVIADDLACCGRRVYRPGKREDPFRHMAESILDSGPDPTMGSPIQDRLEHLLHLIEENDARGVIFHNIKFCEPELFDLPELRKGLQHAGIPSMTVEVDINDSLSHQLLTRIEAFFEMIA